MTCVRDDHTATKILAPRRTDSRIGVNQVVDEGLPVFVDVSRFLFRNVGLAAIGGKVDDDFVVAGRLALCVNRNRDFVAGIHAGNRGEGNQVVADVVWQVAVDRSRFDSRRKVDSQHYIGSCFSTLIDDANPIGGFAAFFDRVDDVINFKEDINQVLDFQRASE